MREIGFIFWHYIKANQFILQSTANFILFSFHFFSVKFLLKNLFTPWRRMEISSRKPGFSLSFWWQKFSFNLISRIIGFLGHTIFIIFGFILALFFFFLGLTILLIWQFVPFISFFFFYLDKLKRQREIDFENYSLEKIWQSKARNFLCQRLNIKTLAELKNLNLADIKAVLLWKKAIERKKKKKKQFWLLENLYKINAIGFNLAFGFTVKLNKYCVDLSFPPPFSHQLVGREKEVGQIEAILKRKSQNDVILVGSSGVGKHTIILGLAKAIREKRVHQSLFYKKILELDMNLLLGSSPALGEVKANFEILLKEAESAGNIILLISQMEKYFSNFQGVDLTAVLIQVIKQSKVQIIGTTTPSSYEKFIFPNALIIKYFEKVEVVSPSPKQALNILMQILPDFEKGTKVKVSYSALKEIVLQSAKLISNIPFPEKAIDFLDEIIAEFGDIGYKVVSKEDVDQLISRKTKVPLGNLSEKEKEKLKNLSVILERRIIAQDTAISAITTAMQRARLGIGESSKPIGSFLFMGPTGVGKTETAKAISQAYFGNEKSLVRFDMSQFQSSYGAEALIGSPNSNNFGLLVKEAREHPYGVLLLDEFEKANTNILNLFLTVFDEGYLKDNRGKEVSFKNMIIICTSNAAAEFIREKMQPIRLSSGKQSEINNSLNNDNLAKEVEEYVLKQHIFSPELLNRFDQVVVFKPLEFESVKQISFLLLKKLVNRLAKENVFLTISQEAIVLTAELGYSLEFGARPIKRLIADKIESLIAREMLDDKIRANDKIKLTVDQEDKTFKIEKYG